MDTMWSTNPWRNCSGLPIQCPGTQCKGLNHIFNKCSECSGVLVMTEALFLCCYNLPNKIPLRNIANSSGCKSLTRSTKVYLHLKINCTRASNSFFISDSQLQVGIWFARASIPYLVIASRSSDFLQCILLESIYWFMSYQWKRP
jgi:hypothetical protein